MRKHKLRSTLQLGRWVSFKKIRSFGCSKSVSRFTTTRAGCESTINYALEIWKTLFFCIKRISQNLRLVTSS